MRREALKHVAEGHEQTGFRSLRTVDCGNFCDALQEEGDPATVAVRAERRAYQLPTMYAVRVPRFLVKSDVVIPSGLACGV